MTSKMPAWIRAGAGVALTFVSIGANAQQSVPSYSYSGTATKSAASAPSEADVPKLSRIPNTALSDLFHVDPTYRRASAAGAKVVGAFKIGEPATAHFVKAWALGFLPVALSFSDGRCYSLEADYVGGTLSNGRLSQLDCGQWQGKPSSPPPPSSPAGRSLRLIGSTWGYGAWADDVAGTTIITAPYAKTFEPLFTARMATSAILAMTSPDTSGGNMTLVGRLNGQLTVVTLEVSF